MGAGRKTQTFIVSERTPYSSANSAVKTRNLRKSDLCGVIFGTTHSTITECLSKRLFGLPPQHFCYVKNIDPGLPLFLFNYSDRKLYGIFEAASPGRMNINPYGWTDGSMRTPYPSQVRMRIRMWCEALLENQFKQVIIDNYYTHHHFWFDLDHAQTERLICLFSSSSVPPSTTVSQSTSKCNIQFKALSMPDARQEGEYFEPPISEADFAYTDQSTMVWESSSVAPHLDGESNLLEAHIFKGAEEKSEEELVYGKLKTMSLESEHSNSSLIDDAENTTHPSVKNETCLEDDCFKLMVSEKKNEEISVSSTDLPFVVAQLMQGMEELKTFQLEQIQKNRTLEQKLVELIVMLNNSTLCISLTDWILEVANSAIFLVA